MSCPNCEKAERELAEAHSRAREAESARRQATECWDINTKLRMEAESEVERLRAALEKIAGQTLCWDDEVTKKPCGDCEICIAKEALSPKPSLTDATCPICHSAACPPCRTPAPKPCAECGGKGDVHSHMLDLGLGDGPEEVRKPCPSCQPPKPDEGRR